MYTWQNQTQYMVLIYKQMYTFHTAKQTTEMYNPLGAPELTKVKGMKYLYQK